MFGISEYWLGFINVLSIVPCSEQKQLSLLQVGGALLYRLPARNHTMVLDILEAISSAHSLLARLAGVSNISLAFLILTISPSKANVSLQEATNTMLGPSDQPLRKQFPQPDMACFLNFPGTIPQSQGTVVSNIKSYAPARSCRRPPAVISSWALHRRQGNVRRQENLPNFDVLATPISSETGGHFLWKAQPKMLGYFIHRSPNSCRTSE